MKIYLQTKNSTCELYLVGHYWRKLWLFIPIFGVNYGIEVQILRQNGI